MSTADPLLDIDRLVSRKYEVGQKLGKGAYGVVWKATEKKSGRVCALKKIFDAFQNATDAQRTYREIIFLKQMTAHENIVRLENVLKAENDKDIYLVFEFMETDLHAAIRANILEDVHKQYIMYQALKALMYMHSAQLVHRDMKPANLLLNAECLMKVADFGLARSLVGDGEIDSSGASPAMTDYVATRWYRAPEILVASSKYGTPVDLWSLGCIFAEMLGGTPAFTGKTTLNQIEKIVLFLGLPSEEDKADLKSEFTASLLDNMSSEEGTPTSLEPEQVLKKWRELYSSASEEALSLLASLMVINPTKRLTALAGLTHPYVAAFHDPASALPARAAVEVKLTDNTKASTSVYRHKLYSMLDEAKGEDNNPFQLSRR